jgi:Holliday junction resolvasome RuvABC endonuclease subunit
MDIIKIAGIDYSMTNPSVCVFSGNSFCFESCQFLVITDYKVKGSFSNITFQTHKDYGLDIQRYENIALPIYDFMDHFEPDYIGLEGYSMGSRGLVFNIGENTAILKYQLYKGGYMFNVFPPTTIKKHATGSGRADKKAMVAQFHKDNPSINLSQMILGKPDRFDSPVSDIVDSYYIAKYLFDTT